MMKSEQELKKGLYFVHGDNKLAVRELYRDQMILLKDSIDDIYNIDAYDINLREIRQPGIWNQISQGEFVLFDGEHFQTAETDPTAVMYTELSRQLINLISYENYENKRKDFLENISGVYSYHVRVGHGNCSMIVFCCNGNYNIWMVDCSVYDFTENHNYRSNLNFCMEDIHYKFGVKKISKLLITHLHYDHINGIEHLIKEGWIDKDTEVWMNTQYPWKQATYIRILIQLQALGVRFVDPVIGNSTEHIHILYPAASFNKKNKAPRNNINNASVLYQICLDGKSMLFTGDMETEGWENVSTCKPYLCNSTYYCISHHGSITGHFRNNCIPAKRTITTLADCADSTDLQVLMGRDGAYKGIFSRETISDFRNIIKTEDVDHYIEIQWSSGKFYGR